MRVCEPPCQNDGICAADHNGKELCFCPPGYSGILCEHSKFCDKYYLNITLNNYKINFDTVYPELVCTFFVVHRCV